jgi:nucleoside-diphosphate-sugar epimerase
MKAFITGATGLIGSHLVERLAREGHTMTTMVRPSSDTGFLQKMGVNICYGDINGPSDSFRPFLQEVEWVFHLAANVSEWASREEMIRANVTSLENLLRATDPSALKRFIFVGSMAVLGMGRQDYVDETAPWVHTGDNYNYTKIMAEQLAVRMAREEGFPITIIRPPYVYGPRDRQLFPRLVKLLEKGTFRYIGNGNQPFALVYVENLVDALVLAAKQKDFRPGEIYMITDDEPITRRELIEILCDEIGIKKPTTQVPVWLAKALCPVFEKTAKLTGSNKPPLLNRFRIKFMLPPMTFDTSKAKRELGYNPRFKVHNAVRESAHWFKEHRDEYMKFVAHI